MIVPFVLHDFGQRGISPELPGAVALMNTGVPVVLTEADYLEIEIYKEAS